MAYMDSPARPVNHQNPARGLEEDAMGNEITEEERELALKVFGAYQEAKRFRRNYDKDWDRFYKIYSGQQWEGPSAEWKSKPVVNFTFSVIETILPIMTDSNPTIMVAPQDQSKAQTAEIIGQITKRVLARNRFQSKLPKWVKNALKYGTGFAKVYWNSEACDGQGDVEISIVDPRHIFPSPGALDVQGAGYFVFAANVPINYIEELYPEAAGRIVPGVWEEDLTVAKTITSQTGKGNSGISGPIQSATGGDGTGGTSSTSWSKEGGDPQGSMERSKLATLIEYWHKKKGRVHLTVVANGIVLRDGESPFKHNKYPFVRLIDYVIPSSFWGMGEIHQLEKLQDFINKRRGQTQDILKVVASPPLVADVNSGINPKALSTRPGSIIYKNPGTEVHWLQPPNIPAALFEVQTLDKQDFDAISGIFDVTQGRKPSGIEAASAIVELQEAAQTRIRLKVRNLEDSLQELGELVVETEQQFYTTKRVVRLVGGDPTNPQFVVINDTILDNTGKPVIINDVTVGKYDVEIGVGSTMPVNKTRLYQQMIELYQMGIVDEQAVLENSQLSPADVMRILQRRQQMLMAQQQMEMGAPPGGSPGEAAVQPATSGPAIQPPSEEEIRDLEN